MCENEILWHALAHVVQDAEISLRGSVAQVSREAKPLPRLCLVQRHPTAFAVHTAEAVLPVRVALASREANQLRGFGVVLRHP